MLKRILAALSIGIAAPVVSSAPAAAQSPAAAMLDAEARQEVVAKLSAALRERYVFPEVGEEAAAKIGSALAAGEYDDLADPAALASRLHADVAAIARDKHLRIGAMNAPSPAPAQGAAPRFRAEAGVVRADKLAGGIGYIEVTGFPPPDFFKPVLDQAMAGLEGSEALIIDVRRNGGGSPESVAYLVSFLVAADQPVHINDIVTRVAGTNDFARESFHSLPTPVSFAGRPLYVLTSNATFSGGEEFAYDVQALERGLLIGEITGGGANPTGPVEIGNGVVATIPFGRAENPVTKTNWEGRGVEPDVAVPAGDALKVALERLGQTPVADIAAASQQQVFAPRSVPLAGSEAAVRQLVAGATTGQPDYGAMTDQFAELTRQHLPRAQTMFAELGELRSVTFREVDMMGGDVYDVAFANGALVMAVLLGPDGKIAGGSISPSAGPGS
jgi:hypothetical protein